MVTTKRNIIHWFFLLPSLIGLLLFYVIPFLYSFYYSLLDNLGSRQFVFFKNYSDLISNELFIDASRNTLIFMGLTIPFGIVIAFFITSCLFKIRRGKAIATIFLLLPLVVPSGAAAYFWKIAFGINGLFNKLMVMNGADHAALIRNQWTMGVIILVYLWKNISFNIILFWSGINWIPAVYYEQMRVMGGGLLAQFRHVTFVYLSPTVLVVILISIVNSFKVFKEIQMLYGSYPSRDIYMLQHFFNNQFSAFNISKLSSAAYIMFIALALILLVVFHLQKRLTDLY